ncbi:MAG: hypothetical protein KUG69_04565 [Marinosulfonomonas sp.]|nr:hypothetical protein [Marinosulfonomonas sp.]
MKGLLLLVPVLSCVFAVLAYVFDGRLGIVLAAFFIAGPLVVTLIGLLLARGADDAGDTK